MSTQDIISASGNVSFKSMVGYSLWQRIILLVVLGYEAIGCIVGGIFLIIKPDGSLMEMPVDMMHGVFQDFFIPGLLLLGLGILTTLAFFAVLKQRNSDWLLAGLSLGGLYTWFIVEIAIIRELHWLHAMWGLPVLAGWVMVIPLIVLRRDAVPMNTALLTCGILSSFWYIAINLLVPVWYDDYSMVTFTVSELSAIGAPTRIIWVLLVMLYPLLFAGEYCKRPWVAAL